MKTSRNRCHVKFIPDAQGILACSAPTCFLVPDDEPSLQGKAGIDKMAR